MPPKTRLGLIIMVVGLFMMAGANPIVLGDKIFSILFWWTKIYQLDLVFLLISIAVAVTGAGIFIDTLKDDRITKCKLSKSS